MFSQQYKKNVRVHCVPARKLKNSFFAEYLWGANIWKLKSLLGKHYEEGHNLEGENDKEQREMQE